MPVLEATLAQVRPLPRRPIQQETEDMPFAVHQDHPVPVNAVLLITLAIFAAMLLIVLV